MPKILTVIGTRPEIIKTSKLIPLLDDQFDHLFIFTSQHYSTNMVDIFFDELNVRKPDLFLGAKSSEYESMVKPIQCAIRDIDPDYVIVYGDTNSTYASAIATTNLSKKLIHIEAGCRSFDKKMPEEVNRIQTDHMSHYLFTPTELTRSYLMREGITNNVFIVGNTSVDACLEYSKIAEKKSDILYELNLDTDKYILITAHRQENVDKPENLLKILDSLACLPLKVVFPVHPRTKKRLDENRFKLPKNVIEIKPIGYLDFLKLLMHSSLIITDSGGVQEEAMTLKVPCLTIRNSTEWLETIIFGGNIIVGMDPNLVYFYVNAILNTELGDRMRNTINPYYGKASEKIVQILGENLE